MSPTVVHIIALLMFSPSSPHGVLSTLTPTVSGIDTAGETNGNVAAIPDAEIRDVEAKQGKKNTPEYLAKSLFFLRQLCY